MKKLILYLIIGLILINSIFAIELNKFDAEYKIINEQVEAVLIFEPINEFEYRIPKDAEIINLSDNLELIEFRDYLLLKNKTSSELVRIQYQTTAFIEQSKDNFFILDIEDINSKKINIKIILPEKAVLKYDITDTQTAVIPKTDLIKTDGKRITIEWTEKEFINNKAVLVIYQLPKNYNKLIFTGLVLLITVIIAIYLLKNKIPLISDITKNLYDEEKEIIGILNQFKDKEIWQKQLQLKTNLTKVKLSRRLKSLEKKGLIEKVPYGNTNKIKLKKQ